MSTTESTPNDQAAAIETGCKICIGNGENPKFNSVDQYEQHIKQKHPESIAE